MELDNTFDILRITDGFYRPYEGDVLGTAQKLGCVGSLGMEPDIRTVTKTCEGVVTDEITTTNFFTVSFAGHITIGALRDIFGLSNEGLKTGVRAIGRKTNGKRGVFTFVAEDMYGTEKKLIAYPNMSVANGYAFTHENGADEIAEIEIEFKALLDKADNFYYEAFESEITDEELKTGWSKTFDTDLVLETPIP